MTMGGKAGEVFTEINVTPLTDVFLVLLVIMILIAPLVNQTVLKVDPPGPPSQSKQNDKGPTINVDVNAQNIIKLNGQVVNPQDVFGLMKAIKVEQDKAGKKDIPLNLSSDGNALQKYVVTVMDAAAGSGIKQLRVLPIPALNMVLSSLFNTLYCDLSCPHCQDKIITGIGFRVGSLIKARYKIGDTLTWQQEPKRPEKRPADGNITTLGHFNCDNPKCISWQDCYPDVQTVKITIEKDRIMDVAIYTDALPQEQFAILTEIKK